MNEVAVAHENGAGPDKGRLHADKKTDVTVLQRGKTFCRRAVVHRANQKTGFDEFRCERLKMPVGKIKRTADKKRVGDKFLRARHGHRKISGVVVGERVEADADLPEVVDAPDSFGALLAAG